MRAKPSKKKTVTTTLRMPRHIMEEVLVASGMVGMPVNQFMLSLFYKNNEKMFPPISGQPIYLSSKWRVPCPKCGNPNYGTNTGDRLEWETGCRHCGCRIKMMVDISENTRTRRK